MTRLHQSGPALLAAALLAALTAAGPVAAQKVINKSDKKVIAAFRDVVARPSHSTVVVQSAGKPAALGTVIGEDGWIVTKASELPLNLETTVKLKDGKVYKAKVVGVEDKFDLAMLKIEQQGLKPIEWAASKSAEAGDWIASAGPGDEALGIGVVSVVAREPKAWEMPAPPPPSDSGFMGVQLTGDEGSPPKIEFIEPKGAADKAGIKVGDIVLKVQGDTVTDVERLIARVQKFKAGDIVTLRVKRDGKEQDIEITLGKRPASGSASRGDVQNSMGSKLSNRRGGFPAIMQTDLVIDFTKCGGPAVTLDGKAVGVFIARAGRTESYIIPSEKVQGLIAELKSGKLAPKDPTPVVNIKDLETALTKAKTAAETKRKELKAAKDEETPDEAKVKTLTEALDVLKKAQDEAQKKLDAAKKDVTKKDEK